MLIAIVLYKSRALGLNGSWVDKRMFC